MNISLALLALLLGTLVLRTDADPKTLPLMQVQAPYFGIVYASSSDSTANAIFQEQFNKFSASGANIYSLSLPWSQIDDGTVNASVLFDILKNAQLPPVTVIKTIDTTQLQLPSQFVQAGNKTLLLDGLLFNDSSIIESFKTTIDRIILPFLTAGGFSIAVGNEIDVYLAGNPMQQKPFAEFVKAAKDYIQTKYNANIAVGVVITYEGLLRYHENNPTYAFVKDFIDLSDVAMISYYPPDYGTDHTEDVVRSAFDVMKSPLGDKLFLFTEIGYPSGYSANSNLNTSQDKQDLFFESFFRVMANEPRGKGFSIVQLNDWSKDQCDLFSQQYGINTPEFAEFLCTLGLMTESAVAKLSLNSVFDSLAMLRNGSLIDTPSAAPTLTSTPQAPNSPLTGTMPPMTRSSQSCSLSIFSSLVCIMLVVLEL